MNVRKHCLLLIVALSSNCYALSHEENINHLIKENLPNAQIGLIVQDPQTGKVLYEKRSEENFYPASNTKLFTAAAALKFFGPTFQYQTSLHANPEKIKEDTIDDHIYFVFRGDPSFSTFDLNKLIGGLKSKGIKHIKGNLYIDDTSFKAPYYAAGWTWDSIPWYFSAPISTVILNENKVKLKINKAEGLNEVLKIEQVDKTIPNLPLQANVKSVTFEESEHQCQLDAEVKSNHIKLDGCWPINKTPANIELALDEPREMAKSLIEQALKENQIELAGHIEFGQMPKGLPSYVVKKSLALKQLLRQVLAESNNVYAESLTKALGLAYLGQGTFQGGIEAISAILAKDMQFDPMQMKLSDGSGQSRYNLVSPFLTAKLLNHMYHQENFDVFYGSLSTSGKSGSLSERMKDEHLIGKIVAKTGSATGTSTLSGYFTQPNGKTYVFSLMINQYLGNANAAKTFEHKLCDYLVDANWG